MRGEMSQEVKIDVKPLHQRKAMIQAQLENPIGTIISHDVYEGTATSLKVIKLPIDTPVYRMANGRTQTEQLSLIAEKTLATDYFSAGEEDNKSQQSQHAILRRFAEDGTDSITPIKDELARSKQIEPILITPAGIVVNGNRRLAAMRELYAESAAEHGSFANIDCAVLPTLTADQIDDVEIRLQMRPETKLPYGWVDEALKIQKRLEKSKEEDVVRLMRKKVGELRKAVGALQLAEIYLREWRKKPRDYRLVEQGEQFFSDLVSRIKGKEGELREANLLMAWMLFDNRASLGGRIYDFNKVLGEKAPEVLAKFAERVEIEAPDAEADASYEDELDIDLGDSASATGSFAPIIAVFEDPNRREEAFDELKSVCQTILDAGKTAKEGSSALMAARDANTRLTEIDLTKADPKTYEGIGKQLGEIIHRAKALQDTLAQKSSAAAKDKM